MLKQTLKFLKAISDTQRLRILALLNQSELCVCELREIVGFTMATISQHLSILKDAEIVVDRKEKKWVFYSINWEGLAKELKVLLKEILDLIQSDRIIIQDMEKLKKLDKTLRCYLAN